jgi:hypothetical protein
MSEVCQHLLICLLCWRHIKNVFHNLRALAKKACFCFIDLSLLKWICDTSTGAATGAAHCGSFVRKVFSLLVVSSRWTWWTRWFAWFRPSERNTLCPRENWVVLCSSLPCPSLSFFSTPWKWRPPEPFIAQGRVVYNEPPMTDRWP